jgi:hydroxymethylbilane synthase
MAQARWVKQQLEGQHPELAVELMVIKTSGDRFLDSPIQAMAGKGVFVKEIEDALLQRDIDLAVHSMKDLPTELAGGLMIAAVPQREDPRDVLVSRAGLTLQNLPPLAKVGTGSLRRKAQLLNYRKDLSLLPIRGNVDTRLRKLDIGELDAIVLAAAGLKRIGRGERITEFLEAEICLNAVAQGALAIETRCDHAMRQTLAFMHHEPSHEAVMAERAFLQRLGGGCHVPVGAWATVDGSTLNLSGVVADPEGARVCRGQIAGPSVRAAELGSELAQRLIDQGAGAILAQLSQNF